MQSRLRLPPWSTSRKRGSKSTASPAPPPRILILLPVILLVGCVLVLRHHRIAEAEARSLVYDTLLAASHGHSHPSNNGTLPPDLSHDVPSYIPYHSLYVRLPPALGITLLVLWLCFLFSFLGIVASDFFCPNLSTIACRLGLPDDVAGATMVGWANGAPDLFSTFASLKAGSGSLAIGELIGAASFICSIVAGSMVLVKPFKVQKFNFFRDVGFFTAAVAFSIIILRDGRIVAWESKAMIGMYVAYVVLVAGGSWYRRRRWRKQERERMIRDAWNENVTEVPAYRDLPDAPVYLEEGSSPVNPSKRKISRKRSQENLPPLLIPQLQVNNGEREDYFSSPAPMSTNTSPGGSPRLVPFASPGVMSISSASGRKRSSTLIAATTPGGTHAPGHHTPRHHSHAHNHNRSLSHHAIHMQGRMSFLGAIEFRDVVNSLQAESSANKHLAAFESPSGGDAEAGLGMARHPSLQGRGRPISYHGQQRQTRKQTSGSSASSQTGHTARGSKRAVSEPRTSQESNGFGLDDDEDTSRDHSIIVPEIQVDNPWQSVQPPSVRVTKTTLPAWQLDESTDYASPGESDVTARPGDGSNSISQGGLSRFPSKALRVLGLGREEGKDAIPPKAQRLFGVEDGALPSQPQAKRFSFFKFRKTVGAMIYAVFPSLHNFRKKSFLAMITSLISVPAVLLLNLTLPVVDESEADEEYLEELEKERLEAEPDGQIRLGDDDSDGRRQSYDSMAENIDDRLDEMEDFEYEQNVRRSIAIAQELHSPVATHHHHTHQQQIAQEQNGHLAVASQVPLPPSRGITGVVPRLPDLQLANEDPEQPYEVDGADLTRYLTAVQCFLAPTFAVIALLGDELEIWYIPTALGIGTVLSATTILFFKDETHITRVLSLCCIGFFIAIVWILTIVNEVVGVLQTIGHIFGLSDAILGLTIFAMGNSLGDLVANVTVARMGYPLMALSACFGGPMLNILLGIGVSGTYITSTTHQPVHIEISTTLIVSALSLLAVLVGTLISVPLNGFVMSRKWAIGLMLVYAAVMSANVAVEIKTEK